MHSKMDLHTMTRLFFFSLLLSNILPLLCIDQHDNIVCPARFMYFTEKGRTPRLQIDCRHLGLTQVPTSAAAGFVNTLDLSFNNFRVLQSHNFENYTYLVILLLTNSNITHIDHGTFDSLKHLETINLSNNMLANIQSDIFTQNPKLERLSLHSNPLNLLPQDSPILISSSLLHLDLSTCKLSDLSSFSLSQLPNLQSLDLRNNGLKVLSLHTLQQLSHLSKVNLDRNPWRCSYDFERLACRAYIMWNSQSLVKCATKRANKNINSSDYCKKLSITTPTPAAITTPTDMSTDMKTLTSVNVFQHRETTESAISSEIIPTLSENLTTLKTSMEDKIRHTTRTTVLQETEYRNKATHTSEHPFNSEEDPAETEATPSTEYGIVITACIIARSFLSSIFMIMAALLAWKIIRYYFQRVRANKPVQENENEAFLDEVDPSSIETA